jgi:methyl-accepting chemotaxis protein
MQIKQKMIIGSLLLAAVPVILAGIVLNGIASGKAKESLEEQVTHQLTSVRELKKNQIEDYFNTIRNQVVTLSSDTMIIDALQEFREAFNGYRTEVVGDKLDDDRKQLATYYSNEFSNTYKTQNPGESIDTTAIMSKLSDDAVALQYQYIRANKNPLGEKDALIDAADGSSYGFAHKRFHPHIREYLKKFGFYDIFLVDIKTGNVVYTVFKELDFATSLINGPYAGSGLAQAFRGAAASDDPNYVELVDFAPYLPSYEAPASFIASPIFDTRGKKQGVLIFQMPIERINQVMTSHQDWQNIGLGATGETYIVGQDHLMRSQSRALIEDKAGFLKAIRAMGVPEREAADMDVKNSTIGLLKVKTTATEAALNGKSGVETVDNYRGVPVLSAYTPLAIPGLKWGLMAEMDEAEAFHGVHDMKRTILIATITVIALFVAIGAVVGWFFANTIAKPVVRLSATMNDIERNSDLSKRSDIESKDEIGAMAQSLNKMLGKFQDIVQQVTGSTGQLASAADEMSAITVQTSQGIHEQQSQTDQLATAMNEMAATVQEVAKHALDAAGAATEANNESSAGRQVVDTAVSAINALAADIQHAAEAINRVEEDSERIGTVLDVIRGIAEQTNLLALNAAIEAARAGEQGRGFAVVADEVRTLAGRTQESTQEIQNMIESLQSGAKEAVQLMEQSREQTQNGVEQTSKAGDALITIAEAVARINDMNTQIASAAEQQSAVAEEININVTTINQVAEQSAEGAEQTARSSEDLARLANDLQAMVGQFKA